MKSVLVYIATYNGSSFIHDQIKSILNQKNVAVDIIIADDVSTDNTFEILSDFSEKHDNIKVYQNQFNLGYKKNFWMLIQHELMKEYDYYALSDQDDIWEPEKLSEAIDYIETRIGEKETAVAYSSNLTVVDEMLRGSGKMVSDREMRRLNAYNLILENKCTGCTLVFNNKLRDRILSYPIEKVRAPHDDIICKLAILFGEYYYDDRSFIKYRQHGKNQIGVNKKGNFKKYLKILRNQIQSTHSQCLRDIIECYPDIQDSRYYAFIYTIANYNMSLRNWLKVLLSRKYRKSTCRKTFIFKVAILLRKY